MNILLINHYAGSPEMGMEFRPYYFAKEWIQKDCRVDIFAADYSHLRRVNPKITKDFQIETIDGIRYHWVKTVHYSKNGIKRALTLIQFCGKLWFKAKKIVRKLNPDVVICSSTYPLDTFVGQRLKKISHKPIRLVHEIHDMWPACLIENNRMSPNHPFVKLVQQAENSFCKNADIIVSLLPAAKDYLVRHGMKPEKFHFVSNGVVLEEWENYKQIPEELADHFESNRRAGKFNLCFFGSLSKGYNLGLLIETVKKIERSDLAVTFVGPGLDKVELEEMAKGYEDRFRFFPPIPKKSIPDLFRYIDGVFIGNKGDKISMFGICMNKLFDSMMGAKPILYMVREPFDYIEKYGCGITVNGNTEMDLKEGIEKLLKLTHAEREKMGENGRKAAINEFNYHKLAEKFLKIISVG